MGKGMQKQIAFFREITEFEATGCSGRFPASRGCIPVASAPRTCATPTHDGGSGTVLVTTSSSMTDFEIRSPAGPRCAGVTKLSFSAECPNQNTHMHLKPNIVKKRMMRKNTSWAIILSSARKDLTPPAEAEREDQIETTTSTDR